MFKWNRIVVALIGIPLLMFAYLDTNFSGIPLLIFTNLVVGIGIFEFYKMLKLSGKEVYDRFGILVALIIPNLIYIKSIFYIGTTEFEVILFAGLIILIYRVLSNQIKGTLEVSSLTILGIIYVSCFFSQILRIYNYEGDQFGLFEVPHGFLFLVQVLVWASDTFAGIVGLSFGRKIFKNGFTEISPKKSIEGAIGSLVLTGVMACVLSGIFMEGLTWVTMILSFTGGLFISFISQIGDLVESLFKRECGIKDSGTILMGHGGVLDRFDSMLLVIPIVYIILLFNRDLVFNFIL